MRIIRKRRLMKKINSITYTAVFTVAAAVFVVTAINGREQAAYVDLAETESVVIDIVSADREKLAATNVQKIDSEPETTIKVEKKAEDFSNYKGIFVMNTSGSLNIRANADSNAEVVGQLEENAGGSVIEYGSQWCKIKSGKVTGFVATSYILIGDDARKALKANGYVATIKTDTLKVRSERNTDSSILGMVGDGEKFKCKKVYDKWIKISYEGKSGYLSKEFVSLECEMTYAKTMSQIQAERETEAPTEAPTVETPTEPIVAEEPETQPAASKNNRIRPNRTIKTDATKVSYDDKYLLACLVACEAGGETYEGKLAVANVVLNRVKSSSYPNSIKDVIYQRGQFGPVSNSSLDKMLKNGPDAGSTKAANAALGGTNNVPGFLSFGIATSIDTSSLSSYQIIDSQVFY